jgi:hypothetical protein
MSEGSKLAIGLHNYMSEKNDIFDFQMPDITEPIQDATQEFKDKDNVGFRFGFMGSCPGGGTLAEAF